VRGTRKQKSRSERPTDADSDSVAEADYNEFEPSVSELLNKETTV